MWVLFKMAPVEVAFINIVELETIDCKVSHSLTRYWKIVLDF
jgi:hypothetical protein